MTTYERKIKKIMEIERCDSAKAVRFYELSKRLTADDFSPEAGREIYAELELLRKVD